MSLVSSAPRRDRRTSLSAIWTLSCALALPIAACDTPPLTSRSDVPGADGGALDAPADVDASMDAPLDGGLAACPCFDGPGTYCSADAAARAATDNCELPSGDGLLACDETGWSVGDACSDGCASGETGATAACALPACDCFVAVSWCGASAARHGLTLDPPCRVPLSPENDEDILGCDGDTWVVLEACDMGCEERPTGTPDACVSDRSPEDPGWPDCAERPLLHSGLHPEASDRLRCAGVEASRISQTVGYASASAGYHAPDGTADGADYTAAVDLRTRDLSTSEIHALLSRLATHGFAAWYRQPGHDGWPSSEAPHIHAVFAGVVMKSALRSQVRDWLEGRNGLTSHARYGFHTFSAAENETVRLLFTRHYTP